MDEELRDLERRVAQGDKYALYSLLVRRGSLNDFDLAELSQKTRRALALELARAFRTDLEEQNRGSVDTDVAVLWAEILTESNPTFYPDHTDDTCPACGALPHAYIDTSSNTIWADDMETSVLDGVLWCSCGDATWRSPGLFGLANEDIGDFLDQG